VDDTWFVDTEPALARRRIAVRHMRTGVETVWISAVDQTNGNDVVNGEVIRSALVKPKIKVTGIESSVNLGAQKTSCPTTASLCLLVVNFWTYLALMLMLRVLVYDVNAKLGHYLRRAIP